MLITVKDPVCGMAVSEHSAKAKSVYKGQTYYFCSALCKQLFEREPQQYVKSIEERASALPDVRPAQ